MFINVHCSRYKPSLFTLQSLTNFLIFSDINVHFSRRNSAPFGQRLGNVPSEKAGWGESRLHSPFHS